jgi:uncharacterized protein YoxC
MDYLKRFWNWLLNKTTIDEKIEAKVAEVKKEVIEAKAAINTAIKETGDVAKAVAPKKRKSKSRRSGASAQTVSKSGASSQSFKK